MFESGLYDGDQIESPGHVEVYSHSERNGFVRRANIYCSTTRFTVHEACGTHQMAGKITFELADPTSVERLLAYVKNRVEHWTELERVFADEPGTVDSPPGTPNEGDSRRRSNDRPLRMVAGSWFGP